MKQSQTGARLKRKITLAVMLIVVVAVVISNAVGLYIYHDRELAAARQNLDELLNLMDAQSYVTNAEELVTQFGQAAPEKRLTIISAGGRGAGGQPERGAGQSLRPAGGGGGHTLR